MLNSLQYYLYNLAIYKSFYNTVNKDFGAWDISTDSISLGVTDT